MYNLTLNQSQFQSNFDPQYHYDPGTWALTVVRPPNDEHAEIIIEGVKDENGSYHPFMRYAHLTSATKSEAKRSNSGGTPAVQSGIGFVRAKETHLVDHSLNSRTWLVSSRGVEKMWRKILAYQDDPENHPVIYSPTNLAEQREVLLTKHQFIRQLREADNDLCLKMFNFTKGVTNFTGDSVQLMEKITELNPHKKTLEAMQNVVDKLDKGTSTQVGQEQNQDKQEEVRRLLYSPLTLGPVAVDAQTLNESDTDYSLICQSVEVEKFTGSYAKWVLRAKYKKCPVTVRTYAICAAVFFIMRNPTYVKSQYIYPTNCLTWVKERVNPVINNQFKDIWLTKFVDSPTLGITANNPSARAPLIMVSKKAVVPPSVHPVNGYGSDGITLEFNFPVFKKEKDVEANFEIQEDSKLIITIKDKTFQLQLTSFLRLTEQTARLKEGIVRLNLLIE